MIRDHSLRDEPMLELIQSSGALHSKFQAGYFPAWALRVKRNLHASIENADLDLNQVAREFSMSKLHFLRLTSPL